MNRNQIREKSDNLLKEFGCSNYPIDIFSLVESVGLNIIFEEMEDDHSGFLLIEKGKGTVAINSKHHSNRQRFTAAHELGHYVLHAQGLSSDKFFVDTAFQRSAVSSTGSNTVEIEANRFAAEILMPKEILKVAVTKMAPLTDLSIYQLALDFEVSEQAMTLRLVNLRLIEN